MASGGWALSLSQDMCCRCAIEASPSRDALAAVLPHRTAQEVHRSGEVCKGESASGVPRDRATRREAEAVRPQRCRTRRLVLGNTRDALLAGPTVPSSHGSPSPLCPSVGQDVRGLDAWSCLPAPAPPGSICALP